MSRARVAHIGDIRPSRGRTTHTSLEGIGLSVTDVDEETVEAWREIARLGDAPATVLARPGGRFALHTASLDARARQWGVSEGFAEEREGWRVSWIDEEEDDERYAVFADRAEAEAEAVDLGEREVQYSVAAETVLAPRQPFLRRWRAHFAPEPHHFDVVTELGNMFVASEHPSLDGVWWLERLDPAALSAPRGVILPHAQSRWRVRGQL